jgi:hypothetical protein
MTIPPPLTIVSANAGTRMPGTDEVRSLTVSIEQDCRRLWVPAFAGTTLKIPRTIE